MVRGPRNPSTTGFMGTRYTLVIGSKINSSWSLRAWLVMKVANLPFSEQPIPWRRPETKAEILRHSPSGKVPALVIAENGRSETVWDSLAICETLAERHPEAQLWPQDATARAHARSIVAEMHSGFPDLRSALSMEIGARRPTPPLSDALQAQIARIIAIWESTLARFADESGFLLGRFTIADAFY